QLEARDSARTASGLEGDLEAAVERAVRRERAAALAHAVAQPAQERQAQGRRGRLHVEAGRAGRRLAAGVRDGDVARAPRAAARPATRTDARFGGAGHGVTEPPVRPAQKNRVAPE